MDSGKASESPYVVLVTFKVDPAQAAAFQEVMLNSAPSVRGAPGNYRYDFNADPADPTRFMLYEIFEDEAAWQAHHVRPEIQTLLDRIKPMLAAKPDRSTWTSAERS